MKKIILSILLVSLLVITLVGCVQKENPSSSVKSKTDDKISIVATIFPQYDFARAIVGDKAELTMLINPGGEIHSYDPSPTDIIKIQNADVFIYIGGENDEWVNTILESMDTSSKKIVRLMDAVTAVEEETIEGMEAEEDHHHDDEKEEDHQEEVEYDEHIWTSPKNAILMINAIANAVCEIDAKNADAYTQNAKAYAAQIQEVDNEIKSIVDHSSNKLLVFGDRFPFRYFVDEFGLDYRAAFNGCSTDTDVSAGTLAYLIDTVKENSIPSIFYIELSNQNIAKAISEQTGSQMLLLHSCQSISKDDFQAGATYYSLMKQNAENLKKGLN